MPPKRFLWKLGDCELQLGDRTLIAAVLEMVSGGTDSRLADPDRAFAAAVSSEEMGADLIELATGLGLGEQEELRRLVPVMKRLRGKLSVPVVVATGRAAVAARAIELGAAAIYDPSGLTVDPALAKTVAGAHAGLIVGHMRGRPETWARLGPSPDLMGMVKADLKAALLRARRAGLEPSQMVLDPGLGQGKRKEENALILARLDDLRELNLPLAVAPAQEPGAASAALIAAAVLGGAHLIRFADVETARAAAKAADLIVRAG